MSIRSGKFKLVLIIITLVMTFQVGSALATGSSRERQQAFDDQRSAAQAAVHWLVREFQNDDGGYASLSTGANEAPSSIPGTLDAILAIAATGNNPAARFPNQESTPIRFLVDQFDELLAFAAVNGGQAGKVVLALSAAAVDPRQFEGHNFVDVLTDFEEPSGAYAVEDAFKQGMAILGLASVGEPVPDTALVWLTDKQAANGSWDDGFGTMSNPDATAIASMALLAAGRPLNDPTITAAKDFMADARQESGWEYGPGFGPNPNSTALVIQALSAMGEDWYSDSGAWVVGGQSPLQALLAFQSASGAFQSDFGQGPFDDAYATMQAIPAVTGRPWPLPARFEAARRGLTCLDDLQDSNSGGWPAFAGGPVDAAGTSRAIQAIVAAGDDPRSPRWTSSTGQDAVEALEALTPDYLNTGRGGRVGIVMQGVVAAGPPQTVGDFAGMNLPAVLNSHLSAAGEYDSTAFGIFAHAEAMLGLIAADEAVAPSAIDVLLDARRDGGWGEADATGMALQVLGWLERGVRAGTLNQLRATQTAGGGWGFGGVDNPSASAEVVQGLVVVGQNPFGSGWSQVVDGRLTNAADVVMAQQTANGCWPDAFGGGDDPYSTTDAILLLSSQPQWGFSYTSFPLVSSGQ